MKKSQLLAIVSVSIFILSYCKSESEKEQTDVATETVTEASELAGNVSKEPSETSEKWKERRAKGDTVAMALKDVQNYLPQISEFNKVGNPKGEQVNMNGKGSWTQAEQLYKNGPKTISVKIFDYNAAYQSLLGAKALYKTAFSSKDDTKKQGAVDLGVKDVAAYESVYKDGSHAELVLIISDRFVVQIESNTSSEATRLRSIAKSMKLEELASK